MLLCTEKNCILETMLNKLLQHSNGNMKACFDLSTTEIDYCAVNQILLLYMRTMNTVGLFDEFLKVDSKFLMRLICLKDSMIKIFITDI